VILLRREFFDDLWHFIGAVVHFASVIFQVVKLPIAVAIGFGQARVRIGKPSCVFERSDEADDV
jgi:hypothetical protein